MANSPIKLSREWKQSLTSDKYIPYAMKVSLFDLMFYTVEQTSNTGVTTQDYYVRYNVDGDKDKWDCVGFSLPHSTIVFDERIYKWNVKDGNRKIDWMDPSKNPNGPIFEDFIRSGVDISIPVLDYRSKPLFLHENIQNKPNNVEKYVTGAIPAQLTELLNALKPNLLQVKDYFFSSDQTSRAKGFKIWDEKACIKPDSSFDFYTHSVLATPNGHNNAIEDYQNPYIVGLDYDPTLDGFRQSQPDIILCNRDIIFENRFLDTTSSYKAFNKVCVNYESISIWKNLFKYYDCNLTDEQAKQIVSTYLILDKDRIDQNLQNPILLYLLRNCFLWIKCSFFADYIDYRDFNQTLNQKGAVIHDNLILSKRGDFNRYDEVYNSVGNIKNKDNELYTRPYVPTITPIIDLIRDTLIPNMTSDLQNNIKSLIDYSSDPKSDVGAIPVSPFEDNIPGVTSKANINPPPVWFDPESRKEPTDYNDYPIVYPEHGNAIIDGRILSPTIDEIWKIIKQMIGGRRADNYQLLPIENNDPTPGYPTTDDEKLKTTFDTRPSIRKHTFNGKEGDPVKIELDNSKGFVIKEWINNPSKIEYRIIKELRDLYELITQVSATQNTLPNYNRPDNITQLSYSPTQTVPTLRELEAIIKGLRWNFSYYLQWITHNGVYAGPLGRNNTDTLGHTIGRNNAGGTAYQLHKDYDSNQTDGWKTPNTVYDARNNQDSIPRKGIGVGKLTAELFDPATQDFVPPHTVFMSAAGTFQSVSQCMNLRIRTDEEF